MIISILVVELHSQKRLFRSSAAMTSAQMNYYLTEFSSLSIEGEGVYEKDTFNFVYSTTNTRKFGLQVTKDHSIKNAFSTLKFIIQSSGDDLFDALVVIDNVLYGGLAMQLELQPILELDSQEEKIYKMMMENKRLEMAQREKENKMRPPVIVQPNDDSKSVKQVHAPKPKVSEVSTKPILLIIREKLKLIVNRENHIKENSTNGEVVMVITDSKYKNVEIKMKNLKSSFKFSPYLDKTALKKSILRFDRDRGLNKSIPLLKWTSDKQGLPITFEFWNDEEDGKYVNIVDIKSLVNVKNLEIKFNRENVSEIEVNEDHTLEDNAIVWNVGNLRKDDSKNVEIKCSAYDKDCLFPISVSFVSNTVDSSLDVEKMTVYQEDITEFEVRKIVEIEHYEVVAE